MKARPTIDLQTLEPSSAIGFGGHAYYSFVGTDIDLLAAGIAMSQHLPNCRRGNRRMIRGLLGGAAEFVRLTDGRIQADIPVLEVARRDGAFQEVIGRLIAGEYLR